MAEQARKLDVTATSAGVTREGILRLDQPMLDSWWNSLGFGDVTLWRTWEHDWSQRPPSTK